MVFTELVILILTLVCTYLFIQFWKVSTFFSRKGIPYVKPIWPVGSIWRASLFLEHGVTAQVRMYNEMEPHKLVGFYQWIKPFLLVRDPEYAQRIFTTDFSHFVDRFVFPDDKNSPLDGHLFAQQGAKWRYLRAKLSPIFTSGKLKWMFSEMSKCVDVFTTHLNKNLSFGKDVDMKEECQGFTIEVISSCAFGMESNTIGNPDSEFRKFSRTALKADASQVIKNVMRQFFPALFRILRLKAVPVEVEDFVMNLVKQSFDHRLKTGYVRNDFIQLLLQLREKGSVDFEENENEEDEGDDEKKQWDATKHLESHKEVLELNDGVLGAQLFVFLLAGFETTASTIYHLLYLFSVNQDCQEKARQEVKTAVAKHGDITYEMLKNLRYLSHCVDETLRLFPPLPFHFRLCVKDYTFPDGTTIEKGTMLNIPIYAMQRDPKYFPEPEKFKPERFEEEIVKGTYSPFGEGPRICIGKRFALIEIQLALARVLMQFRILPSTKPNDDLTLEPKSFLLNIKKGVKVRIEKLE